jgi:hypothetical protein
MDIAHAPVGAFRLGWSLSALEPVSSIASALVAVPETFPLREAVVRMATAHQRQVLVVDECGAPVGLLRDVDALHGLHARTEES